MAETSFEQFFDAFFASKGYPFKNIFDFITAGDWDCVAAVERQLTIPVFQVNCVAAVERLPALHYSVDFISLSFGIMALDEKCDLYSYVNPG